MVELEIDSDLGVVRLLKITAAHDVGKAINPMLVEGQIEGGIAQGLGFALMEEFFPGQSERQARKSQDASLADGHGLSRRIYLGD